MRIKKDSDKKENEKEVYPDLKIRCLNKIIDEANGVRIYFAVSSLWYGLPSQQLK